ncbi:MAG: orotidine 5'-phosphate decarboxylase [Cirrosporium novae-zelandiae]|nr:MAG: orotidine 5'-phosphate decarboxylase [Cirrosporium novae-zelandiae]
MPSQPSPKQTTALPFNVRASLPHTHPITCYLLHLMYLKKTNLCVSADVHTSAELLSLAEDVGESICVLKTHADIIDDWSPKTAKSLKEIAERKRFVIFEDRKFGDIGSTVQKQYTSGPLQIVRWATLVNAHIFPGPAIVTALKEAAHASTLHMNHSVSTEISATNPPRRSSRPKFNDLPDSTNHHAPNDIESNTETEESSDDDDDTLDPGQDYDPTRKNSIGLTTTISQHITPALPPPLSPLALTHAPPSTEHPPLTLEILPQLPNHRGLLLLAEMSSASNLMTPSYTSTCVELARQHPDFVIGFIAQSPLNNLPQSNFLVFTPGVLLPPPGVNGVRGDGLGQQYKGPREAILEGGADVVIVGRGVYRAENRREEAEKYRKEAWNALKERVGER